MRYSFRMFVRTKTQGERTRVQVVKSVRINGQPRQRVVRHVGTATSEAQLRHLRQMGRVIIEELQQEESPQRHLFSPREYAELYEQARRPRPVQPFEADLSECREEARVSVGLREAFEQMYRHLGWERLLGARRMSANRIIKELVLARVAQPLSKRATVRELARHGDVRLNLEQVYKTMDYLDEGVIARIRGQSYAQAQKLYEEPLNVLFYDTTTLYFESELADGLRAQGYSKDGKPHRVQVLLALLVTADGIPCGYELFPGNAYEGHTLMTALKGLSVRHPEARFTVVADAGLLNADNQRQLKARGIPYILGARLKQYRGTLRQRILDPEGFLAAPTAEEEEEEDGRRFKSLEIGEERLVVAFSPKRAVRDARQRQRALQKLCRRLRRSQQPAAVSHSGYARFLNFPEGRIELNLDKIAEAAQWDGLRGITAWGLDHLQPHQLLAQYHRLWEIEACFRINKHDLKIRPIFHWAERRVRAHIAICYMAFCCLQHLRHRLTRHGSPMSPDEIRRELNALQISILLHPATQRTFGLPSKASSAAKRIYRCQGLTWNEAPFPIQRQ